MIYTFYSYKGGVGRSMALANVGELFYQAGLNVLLVDWDLEAPGLERFFPVDVDKMVAHPGVVDMLLDYKHQMTQEWPDEARQFPFKKPSDFTIDLHPDSPKGRLWLLTAGQRDKANFTRYANAVLTFDWKDFYDNWEGEAYFEWLRQQFLEMADVVLIDSRTGITEMGGVCTYQLGDVVVMFCGTSRQNMEGTVQMVAELKSAAVKEARGRSLEVMVIPARVDKESGVGDEFKREFLQCFARHTPEIFKRDSDYFWQLTIPYATVCAYREMIVSPESSVGSEEVFGAFTHLTFALSRLASDDSAIRIALPEKEFQLGDTRVVGSRIGGQVVIAGDGNMITVNLPLETRFVDEDNALSDYLRYVIEINSRLQLQGIRSATGLVSIDLEEVYITLTTTVRRTVPDEETWVEEMARLTPGETKHSSPDRSRKSVQQVKVQVQEVLALYSRLVVLGDPGCGKTTLLHYLVLTYARDLAMDDGQQTIADGGWVKKRLGLDERRLPVLLPLRDFAQYLEKECPDSGADGPKLLLDYLHTYFTNQQLILPQDFFAVRLKAGECIVLLDGIDEIANMMLRQRVARILEKFTLSYPDNRYVVTSRIVGYTGGARLGAGYAVTTVRDFTDADIERFARHWNRAVEGVLAGGATDYTLRKAEAEAAQLIAAIQSNARVRELAINPLLLTVIALVQRYRAQLPDRRIELTEEAVEVLLGQWDAAKGLPVAEMLQGLELDAGDRRSLLEPVALWMMEQRLRELELDDLRNLLMRPFLAMLGDERQTNKAIDGFITFISARSGLLTERGQGIYAFSHMTFQEHLAARAVADRSDNVRYTLERLGDSWWREVILLEAGYLSTQGKRRATELIRTIMEHKEEPEPYHNLVLAAEAVRDVGQARIEGDLAGEIQKRLRQAFTTPLRKGLEFTAQVQRRAAAAEALGRIESGSYGTQPAFWTLPFGEPTWVEIPAGEFWMGSEDKQDESPRHKVCQERFWISKVPVTHAQYRLFVEATAYRTPIHWEEGRIPKGKENHPIVNISWYDAIEYCAWLSTITGKTVALPTEAQWEKAAMGDDPREYPWGNLFDDARSNCRALGLGDTTPVGIFPEGVSPYGCLDMSGNVREWTNSIYRNYPYNVFDGRESRDESQGTLRVVRGGGFQSERVDIRCSARSGLLLNTYSSDVGFRVVVSRQVLPELSRDLTTLREYLTQNFDVFGLDTLCRDVFPNAYITFSKGNTQSDKVDALLAYCRQKPEAGEHLLRLMREPSEIRTKDSPVSAQALAMAKRALAILEEQAAGYTALTAPAHLQIELEEKRREVAKLEKRLGGDTVAGSKVALTMFDQRGQSVSSQVNVAGDYYVSLSELRRTLARLDDVELDVLCLDHFPAVYDKFGLGLRLDAKINLLLDHCRRNPDDAQRLSSLLEK